jgi:hypothetical protein
MAFTSYDRLVINLFPVAVRKPPSHLCLYIELTKEFEKTLLFWPANLYFIKLKTCINVPLLSSIICIFYVVFHQEDQRVVLLVFVFGSTSLTKIDAII